MYKMLFGTSSPEEVRIRQSRATHGGGCYGIEPEADEGTFGDSGDGGSFEDLSFCESHQNGHSKKKESGRLWECAAS